MARIGAEIERREARRRTDIDSRLTGERPQSQRDVGRKAEDKTGSDRVDMAKAGAASRRPLFDDLPAGYRHRFHRGIEGFRCIEIEENRLDLRIGLELCLAPCNDDAWRRGACAGGQSLAREGKVGRIGKISRNIRKTRQPQGLLREIGRISQQHCRENKPRKGLPGALAPAVPDHHKSQNRG